MKKSRKKESFIKKPYYPGGMEALREFIAKHQRYTEAALQAGIEGVVRVRMSIAMDGSIRHARVICGLGYGLDEDALRITRLLRYAVPPTRNLKAIFHKTINVHYHLNKSRKSQYNYNYSTTRTENTSPTGSYHYTIQWGSEEE